MDAGDRALLEATVRDALERVPRDPSPNSYDALAALGWLEMLDAESRDAIDIVFTALGTTNASATVLDDVIVAALGAEPRADLAVLLPAFATWTPPGHADHGVVRAAGLSSARIATATELLVVATGAEQLHTIERWTRVDAGHLVREVTIDDPGAYSRPFTVTFQATLVQPGDDLMEYVCQENNQYGFASGVK